MKKTNKRNHLSVVVVFLLMVWPTLARAAGNNYNLSHFLTPTDPVKQPAASWLETDGHILADNIHNNQWDAPLLRSPKGFEALRYAYENDLIDKDEFLDAQDYLQIQADFAAPETQAFEVLVTNGQLPTRVPAVHVTRIHYTKLAERETPDIISARESGAIERFGWVTSVEINPEFYSAFSKVDTSICHNELEGGDFILCHARVYQDERMELLYWYKIFDDSLSGLSTIASSRWNEQVFYLGSIPLYLSFLKSKHWYPMEFVPLYGELVWEDLLGMREHDKNPGTIYHPDVTNNFFRPDGLYCGASGFVRHDLAHQKIISHLSTRERRFLAWLHRQEEQIIRQMDQSFSNVDPETRQSYYSNSHHVVAVKLGRLCQGERDSIVRGDKGEPAIPAHHYWATPGSHRSLFIGVFADMASTVRCTTYISEFLSIFDERWKNGYLDMGKTLKSMLEKQCQHAGYYYSASFDLYHGLLENLLLENRDYIRSEFGLSVDDMLSADSLE